MLRKVCVGTITGLLMASCAVAQVGSPSMKVSANVLSKYIWNGINRVESRGLEDGAVFQPRVEMGIAGSPLLAHVGGSFTLSDDPQLHEAVYGVSIERAVSPVTSLLLGYDFYDDRATVLGENLTDLHELQAGLTMRSPSGVTSGVMVKHENPTLEGSDSYFVAIGSLSQSVPVIPAVAGNVGVNINWSTAIVYNTSVKVQDLEVVEKGIAAYQFGLSGEILAGGVVVVPQVNYQVTVDEAINDENPFWAGLGVVYGF